MGACDYCRDVQDGVPQLVLGKRQNVQPDCPAGEEKNHPAFKRMTCVSVAAQHFLLRKVSGGGEEGPLGVPH